jgi:hypothetical protein
LKITKKLSKKRITHQDRKRWCGFDENLEQGARCKRQPTNHLNSRVFTQDFAAKLPTAPQLTALKYASSYSLPSICDNTPYENYQTT